MTLRQAAQQALEALEIGYDSAKAEADQFHSAMAGYKPQRHAQMDADVQTIAKAITALKQALAEPETEVETYKRLYELRGKALDRPCSNCGYQPERIYPMAVAEPEQEPVAWVFRYSDGSFDQPSLTEHSSGMIPLYTAPTPRKPLTDEQIDELSRTMVKGDKSVNWLCRAIEAAHGITGEQT